MAGIDVSDLPVADTEEDEEFETKEKFLQNCFVQEWGIIKSMIDEISRGNSIDHSSVERYRSIMAKYQEQGQLLEPYLENIICPVMAGVRKKALELREAADQTLETIKDLCILVYTLVIVCGCKAVSRFFPHDVSDLELAVSLLDKCHISPSLSSLAHETAGMMETKCVLVLWLSVLVLIPFDILLVDTSLTNRCHEKEEVPPLVQRILKISREYLCSAGTLRRAAGLSISSLLARPDMEKAFGSFIQWSQDVLSSYKDDGVDVFLLLGVVEALAAIFKVGDRKTRLDVVPVIWSGISELINSTIAAQSALLRKSLLKLTQRIGMICLPPRSSNWRYVGQNSLLGENLSSNASESYNLSRRPSDQDSYSVPGCHYYTEEDDMDVPEIIGEMMDELLNGLRDTDTVVRWCAAKGIGRITARLTRSHAETVLSSVLELFSVGQGDGSWHGGCLALAELARRGLLLPVKLPMVVPVIQKALHYDIRKGPHSIGSHVRDAAAYVCWAFGRAYSHADMKGVLESLAPHLLAVACYDREVNCRRAAAAAFQENVGRQGNFPHGIDIINKADYYSLSSMVNSYMQVALYIAQYEGYLYMFVEELRSSKVCHWDKGLRQLASKALAALVKYEPSYFGEFVLEKLIPCTLSADLCLRHGATLAVAEIVLALHQCGFVFSIDRQKTVSSIVPAIEKARLYRGKGGEIMRSAISRLIECTSLSSICLCDKTKSCLLDNVNENLKHPNALIQDSAAKALKVLLRAYFANVDSSFSSYLLQKYIVLLDDPNVAARRGSPLALGVLPPEFLVKTWRVVLEKLCFSCLIQDNNTLQDAEARVNAINGVVSVCEALSGTICESSSCVLDDITCFFLTIKEEVVQTLFKALDDYTVDNRGDVGSWVREAAMDGLERCTYIFCEKQRLIKKAAVHCSSNTEDHDFAVEANKFVLFDEDLAIKLVGSLAKQAVEKIDKVRSIAGAILQRILHNRRTFVQCIPHRDALEQIIPNDSKINWGAPNISYQVIVQLLQFSCYSKAVLSGLVTCTGGLTDSLQKASIEALLKYLQISTGTQNDREKMLILDLLWVLQQYKKDDRVIIPALKTVEVLLSKMDMLIEIRSQNFVGAILDVLAVEMVGSKDFAKLRTGISILGYVASIEDPISMKAFSKLLSFLGHHYPKIRSTAADQVYLVLLQNDSVVAEDKLEMILEVVQETCWEGPVEEARRQRLKLRELAGLEVACQAKTASSTPK
ncbi:tubulin-folding cofactor D isoform X1 [Nymphaea colorata]|nr:tubulin-folding cofactor D isoform X1 [Nymphaea colorata]XP_031483379.1 tubulin-folding cofactor D isoform X1 [Nymphaea colorata]